MPAFLTHWRILIATAHLSQDAGSDLGSLIIDAAALRRRAHGWSTPPQTSAAGAVWDTGPFPEIDFRFPGSDISAMAFLGALAPDITYYQKRNLRAKVTATYPQRSLPISPKSKQSTHWSELFHSSHSGDFLITFLEQVALVPSPALRSQALAFTLGYVSHIATDIALNPWIAALNAQGAHIPIELRLDEYLARTYFEHPRYQFFHQPWGDYIEPVARNLGRTDMPTAQLLQLLAIAAEVYGLSEEQTEALPENFLEGVQGLRRFLGGHGQAHWLAWRESRRKVATDRLDRVLADTTSDNEIIAFDKVMGYAERLSTHLCKCAIQYYTALRNPNAEASERSLRRTTLVNDLRNWNLHTGDATGETEDEQTPTTLHNWIHFADLWEQPEEKQEFQQGMRSA